MVPPLSGIFLQYHPFEHTVSVENEGVVDIISIDEAKSAVVLTISDHLDWSETTQHQLLLQSKFNRYLAFVESRELLERYPAGKGLGVRFRVVFKFKPDQAALEFLAKAKQIIEGAGFSLETEVAAKKRSTRTSERLSRCP